MQQLGRAPTTEELAKAMNTTVAQIEELEEVRQQQTLSLETPIGQENEGRLADLVADPSGDPNVALTALFRARTDLVSVLDDLARTSAPFCPALGLEGDGRRLWRRRSDAGLTRERVPQIVGGLPSGARSSPRAAGLLRFLLRRRSSRDRRSNAP